MPAHIKSSLLDSSILIPIKNGKIDLGTWQGIFLFEHRHGSMKRKLKLTLVGV